MGWVFLKKRQVDVNLIHTDLHSHLIPGIDDGASSMGESIHLIKGLGELGFKKLIITPHVRAGSFENDTREFDSRLSELKDYLSEAGVKMELEVGAEQTVDSGFMEHFEKGELKSFGKNKYLLIEFPFNNPPVEVKNVIFELQRAGFRLILAHPERYLYLMYDKDLLEYLHDGGVLFQMNMLSLIGFYDKYTEKFANKLIKMDYIDLIGTDLHHQKHLDGIKEALSNKTLAELVERDRLFNSML